MTLSLIKVTFSEIMKLGKLFVEQTERVRCGFHFRDVCVIRFQGAQGGETSFRGINRQKVDSVGSCILLNGALIGGHGVERREAPYSNVLLGDSCPFNTSPHSDAFCLRKFLCKTERRCQIQ